MVLRMSNTELLQCRTIVRNHGGDDAAVWEFCTATHFPHLTLEACKEVALRVLDLCDYPRTIPIRKQEVADAKTQDYIEGIVRQTLSNGITHKFKGLL